MDDVFRRTEKAIDVARRVGGAVDVFGYPIKPCDGSKSVASRES